MTRRSTSSGKRRGYVHIHAAPLAVEGIAHVDGRLVTTLARTAVDLARSLSYGKAVAIGDAALRAGARPEDLLACLERAAGRPGITQARRVVAFLDPRSETPGESLSRVVLHDLGLTPSHLAEDAMRDLNGSSCAGGSWTCSGPVCSATASDARSPSAIARVVSVGGCQSNHCG